MLADGRCSAINSCRIKWPKLNCQQQLSLYYTNLFLLSLITQSLATNKQRQTRLIALLVFPLYDRERLLENLAEIVPMEDKLVCHVEKQQVKREEKRRKSTKKKRENMKINREVEEREYVLVSYDELPEYMKENEYIRNYYRSEWPISHSFFSLFSWHNETINIWTWVFNYMFNILLLFFLISLLFSPKISLIFFLNFFVGIFLDSLSSWGLQYCILVMCLKWLICLAISLGKLFFPSFFFFHIKFFRLKITYWS